MTSVRRLVLPFMLLLCGCERFASAPAGSASLNIASSHILAQSSLSASVSAGSAFKMEDSSNNGYLYAYAPSIIYSGGNYHAFFCSAGTNAVDDWDHIRYATSSDLVNWSPVQDIMQSTPGDRSNCDPSVVQYDAGDGAYFYMVYAGVHPTAGGTANFLARAASPAGPWLKYTMRSTWETRPTDPKPIVSQFTGVGNYGAGQASLVVKDGMVYQFYMDDTAANRLNDPETCFDYQNSCFRARYWLTTSRDMIHWSAPQPTNVFNLSVDVKLDASRGQFLMAEIISESNRDARLGLRTSRDGITWTETQIVCDANCFPDFAHNVGLSGDNQGHLIAGAPVLISFGAPYDLNPAYTNQNGWAGWDLYGLLLNLPSAGKINGYVEGINGGNLTGWACADALESSIGIHVYVDGPAGQGGTFALAANADQANEEAVSQVCETSSHNHRFSIPLSQLAAYSGRRVFVHGISPTGQSNDLLNNSGTVTLPAAAAATASCSIKGGAGLVLFDGLITRTQCATNCLANLTAHPNLSCLYQGVDIAPTDLCAINGGAGASIFSGVVTHAVCNQQCQSNAPARPNLTCMYQGVDLAPRASCSVIGGAGLVIHAATETRGQCTNACNASRSAHPKQSCSWNGGVFSAP